MYKSKKNWEQLLALFMSWLFRTRPHDHQILLQEFVDVVKHKKLLDDFNPDHDYGEGVREANAGIDVESGQNALLDSGAAQCRYILSEVRTASIPFCSKLRYLQTQKEEFDLNNREMELYRSNRHRIVQQVDAMERKIGHFKNLMERIQVGLDKQDFIYKDQLKNKLGEKQQNKRLVDHQWFMVCSSVLIAVPETLINFYSIQAIFREGNNLLLAFTTIVLSGSYIYLAKLLGRYLEAKLWNRAGIVFGVACILLAPIMIIRVDQGAHFLSMALYIFLFLVTVVLSYLHSERSLYFEAEEQYQKLLQEKDDISEKISKLEKDVDRLESALYDQMNAQAEDEQQVLKEQVNKLENEVRQFDDYIEGVKAKSILQTTMRVESFRKGYAFAKSLNKNRNGQPFELPAFPNVRSFFATLLLLCALLLGSQGCMESILPPTIAVGVLVDHTGTQSFDASEAVSLMSLFEIERGQAAPQGLDLFVGAITNRSVTKINRPGSVPAVPAWAYNELLRQGVIDSFYNGSRNLLEQYLSQSAGNLAQTHFNRSVANMSRALMRSDADQRYLIIFGDVLENSDVFSAYRYRDHPEQIVTDQGEISARLYRDSPMRLDDVTVIVVDDPPEVDDELSRTMKALFENYWMVRCGAKNVLFFGSLQQFQS